MKLMRRAAAGMTVLLAAAALSTGTAHADNDTYVITMVSSTGDSSPAVLGDHITHHDGMASYRAVTGR
ncbi:hypothetical protein OTB20_39320 [Streptomyces sp. H27-H1]|uniref:hypothetical protein n=1 Tax=Streptomyces sp. H27-H1 TaxID=2996461 RepID=UPI00226E0239|nr:hypothetical protein [Streptomyces sp. H27-H1]MCY0932122.1 hypothetical protein [Streptomyces sp. H27-H1]